MTQDTNKANAIISWDEMHGDVRQLASVLADKGPWKGLVAVARGGLVPAGIVAQELDLRTVELVSVSSYGLNGTPQDQQGAAVVSKHPAPSVGNGEGWIVLDDSVDSGQSITKLRELLPKAHFAVVYANSKNQHLVDSFAKEIPPKTWLVFPWDPPTRPEGPSTAPTTRLELARH